MNAGRPSRPKVALIPGFENRLTVPVGLSSQLFPPWMTLVLPSGLATCSALAGAVNPGREPGWDPVGVPFAGAFGLAELGLDEPEDDEGFARAVAPGGDARRVRHSAATNRRRSFLLAACVFMVSPLLRERLQAVVFAQAWQARHRSPASHRAQVGRVAPRTVSVTSRLAVPPGPVACRVKRSLCTVGTIL